LVEEREAVLARLPGHDKLPLTEKDIRVYYAADIPVHFPDGKDSQYSIIVVPLARMGHTEAANATGDAIRRWRPRYVLLVGIAGGVPQAAVQLGDVLISDQVADYELQKVADGQPSIRWQIHRADQRLLIAAQNFTAPVWEQTKARRPNRSRPQVHFGPICTGNKVIADESLIEQFREVWTKLIGVEMEAGGVANAVAQAARMPGFFMIRGVSDLADGCKDSRRVKRWRPYACEIAAAYAIEFLKSGPVPLAAGTVDEEDSAAKAQQAEAVYRQELADRCNILPISVVDTTAESIADAPLSLAEVYINLDTRQTEIVTAIDKALQDVARGESSNQPEELPSRGREGDKNIRQISALEATILHRRLVLVGDPGSGKSTFINHLTYVLAKPDWARLPKGPVREYWARLPKGPVRKQQALPILVILRDFARWLDAKQPLPKPSFHLLWSFIRHDLKERELAAVTNLLQQALQDGRTVVLLDGLDEVLPDNEALLDLVRYSVVAFANRYQKSRYLLTCRVLSYQESHWQLPANDFPVFELAPFDEDKINRFINAWYQEVGKKWHLPPGQPKKWAPKLREAVHQRDLWPLVGNPLLLTVTALLHAHGNELPPQRALLYRDAVDILLRWDQRKEIDAPQLKTLLDQVKRNFNDLKQKVLEPVAFIHVKGSIMQTTDQATGISESTLLDHLQELHPRQDRVWAQRLLEALRRRSSLLLERKSQFFSFPYPTFEEYLAGVCLARKSNFGEEAAGQLEGKIAYWRGVILLAVGYLIHHQGEQEKPLFLVKKLCPEAHTPQGDDDWRKVWLAGDVLLEMGVNRVQDKEDGKKLLTHVCQQLTALLKHGMLTPRERAEAGDVLGQLGDPRPGVGVISAKDSAVDLPDIDWVEIPAGPFIMGGREDDKLAQKGENPAHKLELPAFRISRYPITNAQYKPFVEDKGYDEPQWWTKEGWAWRQGRTRPNLEAIDNEDLKKRHTKWLDKRPVDKRHHPFWWDDPRWNVPNRPVIGVTWYEALAYCRWLETRLRAADVKTAAILGEEYSIRLPTEAEWEKAARGPEGYSWPWGDAWAEDRANTKEADFYHTSPVGLFPSDANDYGVHDMAGNVWEWTTSRWGRRSLSQPDDRYRYPYNCKYGRESLDGRWLRVMRGGSWGYDQTIARCMVRYGQLPDLFFDTLGFRVVLSLANSGS
jgi:formylglycine-generating enzyme required for sulfatase activity/nucleoside phosphorylase